MIDMLSNPEWLKPQIDFLIFLQHFRLGNLEIFDKFFLSVTCFGEFLLPTILSAVVYWCIDFRAGLYLFLLEGYNTLLTHFFKMIACVYRPWILSNEIKPSDIAVLKAGGYSFPSGHSSMAGAVLGGSAYLTRSKKLISNTLIGLILLVGFSRMWLGVHTPQDVICGLSIGILLVFGVNRVINWAESDKKRYMNMLLITNLLALISLIYISVFNTYRIDYVDGELLVNPEKSIYLTYVVYGYALGAINGALICRRYFYYEPKEIRVKNRVLIGISGVILLIMLLKFVLDYVISNNIGQIAALVLMFLLGLFVTLIYPLIFNKCLSIIKSQNKVLR